MAPDRLQFALNRTQRRARTSYTSYLRKIFFATAGESAKRYGLSFDDVLFHLWHARGRGSRCALATVQHLNDLVHAAACTNGSSLAWQDFSCKYEWILVRHCGNWMPEPDAIMYVRRLIRTLAQPGSDVPCLPLPHPQSYLGTVPLRRWLCDRVSGYIVQHGGWCADKLEHHHGPANTHHSGTSREISPSEQLALDNAAFRLRLRYENDKFISSAR